MKRIFDTIKDISENLKNILNAPILNILIISGVVFVFLSFINIDPQSKIYVGIIEFPRLSMLIIGIVFICSALVINIVNRPLVKRVKYRELKKGITIQINDIRVNLKIGYMEEVDSFNNKNTAIVLPANTSFMDDCITDSNSVLGAFAINKFADNLEKFKNNILKSLEAANLQKNEIGHYPPGTTIVLTEPFEIPSKIMITASTTRKRDEGIKAKPNIIFECIDEILKVSADKKISILFLPIIGSGHGGLRANNALFLILLAIQYSTKFYHHIKIINIIITEKDAKSLSQLGIIIDFINNKEGNI